MDDYTKIELGKKWPGIIPPLPEFSQLHLLDHGNNLFVAGLPDLTPAEIRTFRESPVDIGLLIRGGAMIIMFQFRDRKGRSVWFCCPFDPKRIPDSDRSIEEPEPGERLVMSFALIEMRSGITKALRSFTWHPETTILFHDLSLKMIETGTAQTTTAATDLLLSRYTNEELAQMMIFKRCGV